MGIGSVICQLFEVGVDLEQSIKGVAGSLGGCLDSLPHSGDNIFIGGSGQTDGVRVVLEGIGRDQVLLGWGWQHHCDKVSWNSGSWLARSWLA